MRKLIVVSDNTSRRVYELDNTDNNDILDLAITYGRAESGEVVYLEEDGKEIAKCYWDWQYRKYRR